MKVVCIIPARGGSKRLPRKNIYPFKGKPLMCWPIEACLKSKFLDNNNIFVSSEDDEILNIAKESGVQIIERPSFFAGDNVWTQEVLEHALADITYKKHIRDIDVVIRVQANSPQIKPEKIDECIQKLIDHDLWEVFTVDKDGIEDAAIHVMKAKCVRQKALSVYKGVVITDYIDVHTLDDLKRIEEKW